MPNEQYEEHIIEADRRKRSVPGSQEAMFELLAAQTLLLEKVSKSLESISRNLVSLAETFDRHYNLD
jgi:hypothetical protein